MFSHREQRSTKAIAVTAISLAMGFLSAADAYAQSRRGNNQSGRTQQIRPFTVTPKAPRVVAPTRRQIRFEPRGGGRQRINPPKAPRVTPDVKKFVPPKAPRGNNGSGGGQIFSVPPKAPRVPGGGQQIVAPKAPRINVPKAPRAPSGRQELVAPKSQRINPPKAPRVETGRTELVASKSPRVEAPVAKVVQETVKVPVKRSAKPKTVEKVIKTTTLKKKRSHRKHGYRYHGDHHGYYEPYGHRGYHRSYSYRPHHGGYGGYRGGYGGGYSHCR